MKRCRGCLTVNDSRKRKCGACGKPLPRKRRPKHLAALELPYEQWVARFGERCGICGKPPSTRRRLDRDHWHSGPRAGEPRGLLDARCNRALPSWVTPGWLRAAADYLERAA